MPLTIRSSLGIPTAEGAYSERSTGYLFAAQRFSLGCYKLLCFEQIKNVYIFVEARTMARFWRV